jgi:hypothetical protein
MQVSNASSAASGSDHVPPRLLHAEVVDGDLIKLTLSEAIAPVGNVDPASFRLSAVQQVHAGASYFQRCRGYDASGNWYGCYGHYQQCTTGGTDYCHRTTATVDATFYLSLGAVTSLEAGCAPTELVARLASPLGVMNAPTTAAICGGDPGTPGLGPPPLFFHYAESTPAVEDLAGNRLASIAPAWVHAQSSPLEVAGELPDHPLPVDAKALTKFCAGGS